MPHLAALDDVVGKVNKACFPPHTEWSTPAASCSSVIGVKTFGIGGVFRPAPH